MDTGDDWHDGTGVDEHQYEVWPALTDLFAASAMMFLVFFAVSSLNRVIERGNLQTRRRELIEALRSIPNGQRLFDLRDDPQFVRIILRDDVTFPTKQYSLSLMQESGRTALSAIGRILSQDSIGQKYQLVQVVGHTDQVPMIGKGDLTNWELSALRAAAVVRLLVDSAKVDPCRVSASGAGPYFPDIRPGGVDNRKENRRIEILVLPVRVRSDVTAAECYPHGDGSRWR